MDIKSLTETVFFPKYAYYNSNFYVYKKDHWHLILEQDVLTVLPQKVLQQVLENKKVGDVLEYIKNKKYPETHRVYTFEYIIDSNFNISKRRFDIIDVNPSDIYVDSIIFNDMLKRIEVLKYDSFFEIYKTNMKNFNRQYYSNFEFFLQYYFASLLSISIDVYIGVHINEGLISLYHRLQKEIPNPNLKFGTINDFLNSGKPTMVVDYSHPNKLVTLPATVEKYDSITWKNIIGYGLAYTWKYLLDGEFFYHPVDYTPPEVPTNINIKIRDKIDALVKLEDVEKLGFKEMLQLLIAVKSELDEKEFETLYMILYEKYIEEMNADL